MTVVMHEPSIFRDVAKKSFDAIKLGIFLRE